MFDAIASLLAWFYALWPVPSYGAAIILLTLAVMLVLTPLTMRGTRSMIKMQQMQPEIKKIQREHADDRQKMNEEMMAFYKENQINPIGGCLPLLLQMPVFIVLFRVLQGLTSRVGGDGPDADLFDPKYLSESTELYQDLSRTDTMDWFGIDLAISPADALGEGFVTALPYLVLIVVVLITGYVQQRQIQGRNPNAEINPQQQMIGRVMPAFIGIISFTLQGALVLYFVISNLFRVGQQYLITRTLYRDDEGNPIEVRGSEKDGGDKNVDELPEAKGITAPKGKATPGRAEPKKGSAKDQSKKPSSKAKGSNKRTTSSGSSLPQPRPRKKKR